MKDYIRDYLGSLENGYGVCGIIDRARQAVAFYANRQELALFDADRQNYYLDFILAAGRGDKNKIAIDVKTTYKEPPTERRLMTGFRSRLAAIPVFCVTVSNILCSPTGNTPSIG